MTKLKDAILLDLCNTLESIVGSKLYNVYMYGSRVYGTDRPDSDYDYIVVADVEKKIDGIIGKINGKEVNITAYSPEEFQLQLDKHEISVLECYFLSMNAEKESCILKQEKEFTFKLDKSKLREAISAKCSNSWVKAKKKLTVEADYDEIVAKKSLWHVFRMYSFGVQIAESGSIFDYRRTHRMLEEIMKDPADWEELQSKWQLVRNAFATDFKACAPKN